MTVATLIADLQLDLRNFQENVRRLDDSLGKVGKALDDTESKTKKLQDTAAKGTGVKQLQVGVEQLGLNVGALGQAFALATNPLTIFGAALFTVYQAASSGIDAIQENARQVQGLMAVSGLGAERADNLSDTFSVLGFNTEAVTSSMFRMAQEIETGAVGLTRLGISTRDSAGALKTEGDLFLEVRDRISQMGTAAARNAALMDIFGRAGRALAPVFALSREEFVAWQQRAERLSPWAEEAQQRTLELIRSQNELTAAWAGMRESLGLTLTGPMTKLLTSLTTAILSFRTVADEASRLSSALPQAVTPALGPLDSFISKLKEIIALLPKVSLLPGPRMEDIAGVAGQFPLGRRLEKLIAPQPPLPEEEPGALARGFVPRPPELLEPLKPAEMQAQVQMAEQALLAVQQAMQRGHNERLVAIQAERMSEEQALRAQLADLERYEAVARGVYQRKLVLAESVNDTEGNAVRAVQIQEIQGLGQIEQQRAAVVARLAAMEIAQGKTTSAALIQGWTAYAEAVIQETERTQAEIVRLATTAQAEHERLIRVGLEGEVAAAAALITEYADNQAALRAIDEVRARPMREFQESIRNLGTDAEIAGLGFDRLAAEINITQRALLALRDAGRANSAEFAQLRGQLDTLRGQQAVVNVAMAGFQGIRGAFNEMTRGILQGSQTFGEAMTRLWENIAISISNAFLNALFDIVQEGLRQLLNDSIRQLSAIEGAGGGGGGWLSGLLGALAGSGGGAGTTGGGGTGGVGGLQAAGSGGIVTRPTVVIAGERGAEAIIPLDQLSGIVASLVGGAERRESSAQRYAAGGGREPTVLLAGGAAQAIVPLDRLASLVPAMPGWPGQEDGREGPQAPRSGAMPAAAAGGIATRPTVVWAGERGPEALIPLDRLVGLLGGESESASASAAVEINIIDQRQSGEVERRDTQGEDGRRKIDLLIKDTVKQGMVGGEFDRIFGTMYGLTRVGAQR